MLEEVAAEASCWDVMTPRSNAQTPEAAEDPSLGVEGVGETGPPNTGWYVT